MNQQREDGAATGPSGTQTLDRALDLLDAIQQHGPTLGVGELTRLVELKKPTAIRLLRALRARGYVSQDPQTQRYRLGPRLIDLGAAASADDDYARRAQPELDALAARTGETAHYCVMADGAALFAAVAEGSNRLRLPSQVGSRLPLHASSAGKVLICWFKPEDVRSFFGRDGLTPLTPKTIVDPDRFSRELRECQVRGFAVEDEEVEEGLFSVAAPVRDHSAHIVAAVMVAGPSGRMRSRSQELIAQVKAVAGRLSAEFGSPVAPGQDDRG